MRGRYLPFPRISALPDCLHLQRNLFLEADGGNSCTIFPHALKGYFRMNNKFVGRIMKKNRKYMTPFVMLFELIL